MGWDSTKLTGDDITAQDWNELVTHLKSQTFVITPKRGSNCSGTDGTANRTLTLNNTSLTDDNKIIIIVNNNALHVNVDFTTAHSATNSVVTFVNKIWDIDYITVIRFE